MIDRLPEDKEEELESSSSSWSNFLFSGPDMVGCKGFQQLRTDGYFPQKAETSVQDWLGS